MDLDIRQIAEDLIAQLWKESEKSLLRAEGVKLLYETIRLHAEGQMDVEDNKPVEQKTEE